MDEVIRENKYTNFSPS